MFFQTNTGSTEQETAEGLVDAGYKTRPEKAPPGMPQPESPVTDIPVSERIADKVEPLTQKFRNRAAK